MSQSFGASVTRKEDAALLTGAARFVDDVQLPGTLHMALLRSDVAHASLLRIDVEATRRCPGVVAAVTASDLGEYWQSAPLLLPPPPIDDLEFHLATQVPLVRDRVRHVGEPLVAVVAESRYQAEDALASIALELEDLDPVVNPETALDPDAPVLHEHLDSNLAGHAVQTKGDYAAARQEADRVVSRRLRYDRGAAAAMENRGVVAEWDAARRRLRVWDTTQVPVSVRDSLATVLSLSPREVQVIAPFMGGAFGPRSLRLYPEEMLVPWLALRLGRPVKWIEDRAENFTATSQERLQIHDAELALRADGTILGLRDHFVHDTGAYDPYGLVVPINSQCTALGCYRIPNFHGELRSVFTNTPTVSPVRGAGHQHGIFVIERLLDIAARELGIDRVEIRRRNLLRPDEFPHEHGIYKSLKPLVYDSGNFEPMLDRAVELIDYRDFVEREQPRLRGAGQRVGVGVVTYVEGTGVPPPEGARVSIEPSGRVRVATGFATQGQGHLTSFAQVVADALGVALDSIDVVTGDTGQFGRGTGTFASRGAVVVGNACHLAATQVRDKALALAASTLDAPVARLTLADGRVQVDGVPSGLDLGQLAARANPLRGAVEPGTEPGLEATAYFAPAGSRTASGAHALKVEIDPDTFAVRILDYVVVHDCGRVINPAIVEGQIHGGVAHGVGNAFYERLHYDESGQLLNGSLADYLLPTSVEVPRIRMDHFETPPPESTLGMKGAGEAGGIPVGAVFAQAVEDALGVDGLEVLEIPLSPNRLFELATADRGRDG